jgi:hypothetical protein
MIPIKRLIKTLLKLRRGLAQKKENNWRFKVASKNSMLKFLSPVKKVNFTF